MFGASPTEQPLSAARADRVTPQWTPQFELAYTGMEKVRGVHRPLGPDRRMITRDKKEKSQNMEPPPNDTPGDPQRARAVGALRQFLEREYSPRATMTILLAITGAIGFMVSFEMLHHGVDAMAIRYPIAVALAYVVFIFLLRCWADMEHARIETHETIQMIESSKFEHSPSDPPATLQPVDLGWWNGWDWLDFSFVWACLPVIVIGALSVLSVTALTVVFEAPTLLAEVLLDAVLMTALYKRMRGLERRNWFATVLQRTWRPVLGTAVILAAAGFLIQTLYPDVKSIGQLRRHVTGQASSPHPPLGNP